MSLRDKAREVRAEGDRRRGEYTPAEGTLPLRAYQNWRDNPNRIGFAPPPRENFCHYWRVVLFWAPLTKVLNSKITWVAATLAALAFLFWLLTLIPFEGWLGTGIVVGLLALIVSAITTYEEVDRGGFRMALLPKVGLRLFQLVTLPAALLGTLLAYLDNRLSRDTKDFLIGGFLILLAVVMLGMLGTLLVVDLGWKLLWIAPLFLLGVAGFFGLMGLIVFVAEAVKDWHKDRKRAKRRKASLVTADEIEYEDGSVEPPKRKSLLAHIGTNVLDFFVLLWQVVAVKKYKICPLVEIPDSEDKVAA